MRNSINKLVLEVSNAENEATLMNKAEELFDLVGLIDINILSLKSSLIGGDAMELGYSANIGNFPSVSETLDAAIRDAKCVLDRSKQLLENVGSKEPTTLIPGDDPR